MPGAFAFVLLQANDCVAEARILEKYKELVFYDPDTKKTFKVWGMVI